MILKLDCKGQLCLYDCAMAGKIKNIYYNAMDIAAQYLEVIRSRNLFRLLLVLLVIDGIAVSTDLVTTLLKEIDPSLPNWLLWGFRLDVEYNTWAIYGYLKLIVPSLLLAMCYWRSSMISFALLFFPYAYTTIDDMFTIHEDLGKSIGAWSGTNFAIGETIYFAFASIFILSFLAAAVLRAQKEIRADVALMSIGLLAIGFFAVVVNLIEGLLKEVSRFWTHIIGLVDDGGELVISSVVVVLALVIYYKISAMHPNDQSQSA